MVLILALAFSLCLMGQSGGKLAEATRVYDRMWTEYFAARGEVYRPPLLKPFTGKGDSPCGKTAPGNAYYCQKDNSIYYDSDFLAALRLRVASETKTSGDTAPLIAIAHETGHAVVAQMNRQATPRPGFQQLHGYSEEKVADCLAGAMTRAASQGPASKDVMREAMLTIGIIGQIKPAKGHPDWRIRSSSFLSGFRNGINACSATTFQNLKYPATSPK